MKKIKLEMIIVIINSGFSDEVIKVARSLGISGATVLHGKGTGIHETNTLLGVNIMPEKEIVLILTQADLRKEVMQAICDSAGLDKEAKGFCFSMPVEEWSGICHLEKKKVTIKEEVVAEQVVDSKDKIGEKEMKEEK